MKLAVGLFIVLPLLAHHSIRAEYDLNKTTTIHGTVTKVEWMNPHGRFFLDVADANGTVSRWEIEMGSPNGLVRLGWNRDTIKQGDQLTVDVSPAKSGRDLGYAQVLTWPDGHIMNVPLDIWGMPIPK